VFAIWLFSSFIVVLMMRLVANNCDSKSYSLGNLEHTSWYMS